jgi:AcrR family transcriptional regulator
MSSAGRSSQDTRARLIASAREQFRVHGFDGAGVRAIADGAGVDPALINRYFGGKQGLLDAVAEHGESEGWRTLDGDRSTLGRRLAELVADKQHDVLGAETMIRSLANRDAAVQYEAAIHRRYVEPLAAWLGGRDALLRAGLIVSILNGLTLSLSVLGQQSLTEAARSRLVARTAASLQPLIDG